LAPQKIMIVDDTLRADVAFRLASEGVGLLWRGDYQNARHMLQALSRRADRAPREGSQVKPANLKEAFFQNRDRLARRAGILSALLIELTPDYRITLRRGQDVYQACAEVLGGSRSSHEPIVLPLKGLLSMVSAHEWRKKGVLIPTLGTRIHPHFGVFSPIRGEYLDLVAQAQLPSSIKLAFDIGCGTGVLCALLAQRGVPKVIATDMDERAITCAKANLKQLGFESRVDVQHADLFPIETNFKADLIVCNPPWLPGQPAAPIEYAVYDPDSRMIRGFLKGAADHLTDHGQVWLILSDLAEHLGLRTSEELQAWIADGGLSVLERLDIQPKHPKAQDRNDPLFAARSKERTSLWRLGKSKN